MVIEGSRRGRVNTNMEAVTRGRTSYQEGLSGSNMTNRLIGFTKENEVRSRWG